MNVYHIIKWDFLLNGCFIYLINYSIMCVFSPNGGVYIQSTLQHSSSTYCFFGCFAFFFLEQCT
jgi:hypothetical protein